MLIHTMASILLTEALEISMLVEPGASSSSVPSISRVFFAADRVTSATNLILTGSDCLIISGLAASLVREAVQS